MRAFAPLAAALALAAVPAAAVAQSPEVNVTVSPELVRKAEKENYGARELNYLTERLDQKVERALARRGRLPAGTRLELVLTDARPNRPTQEMMGARPGLSMQSLFVGGAAIEGEVILPDGSRRPVDFDRYDYNLRDAVGSTTWTAANRAFDMFASRAAEGRL
jgi:hypothetical protein